MGIYTIRAQAKNPRSDHVLPGPLFSEDYFKLESNWCKSKHEKAKMLMYRSEAERLDVNTKLRVNAYWLGATRRVFCDGSNYDKCLELIQFTGTDGKCYKASFKWADESPFMFSDHTRNINNKGCDTGKEAWGEGQPDYGVQNHVWMGYLNRMEFDNLNGAKMDTYINGAHMLCTYQGSYNWYFPTRSVYRCGAQFSGVADLRKKVAKDKKFLFAPKVLKFVLHQEDFKADIEVMLQNRGFEQDDNAVSYIQMTCAQSVEDLRVVIDGKGRRADPIPTVAKFEKTFDVKPSDYKKTHPPNLKFTDVDFTEWLNGDNPAAVCTLRAKADNTKGSKMGDPSNIFTAFRPGFCKKLNIFSDRNLVIEPQRGLIKPGDKVTIKCTGKMALSCEKQTAADVLGCGGKGECKETLELECKEDFTYTPNYEDEEEKKPTCTEVKLGDDCKGKACACKSIPVSNPQGENVVKCDEKEEKCVIAEPDKWMKAPDGDIVISTDCGDAKRISGATVSYDKRSVDGTATYECEADKQFGSGEKTQTVKCEYSSKTKRVQWTEAEYQRCAKGKIDGPCNPSVQPSACPPNAVCKGKDKTGTCQCDEGWDTAATKNGKEKFCRYQKCFWDESFEDDDGTYNQRPPMSLDQIIEFHCKPGYYFQQKPNPPSDSVKVKCKFATDYAPFPSMVPPHKYLKCEKKEVGNPCKDDSECAASSVFGTVCKVPAGSSEGICECKDNLQYNLDKNICECAQNDTACSNCVAPPEWDGTEPDPPIPKPPTPPGPGPYTVKCKDSGKVLGNETLDQVEIQCIEQQWHPVSKGSSGELNFDCKEVDYNSSCKPGPDNVCKKGSKLECDGTLGKCMCAGGFSHKDGKCEKDDNKCDPKKIEEGKLDDGETKDIPEYNTDKGAVNTGYLFDCGSGNVIDGVGTQTLKFMCTYGNDGDPKQPAWSNNPDAFFTQENSKTKKCIKKPDKVGDECGQFGESGDFICHQTVPFTHCENGTDGIPKCQCMQHADKNDDSTGCKPNVCVDMDPTAEVEFVTNGSLHDMGYPYSDGAVINIKCSGGKLLQGTTVNSMTGTCTAREKDEESWSPPDFVKVDNETTTPRMCLDSHDCRNGDATCDSDREECDKETFVCKCKEGFKEKHNPEICVPEMCEVDQMNKTCVNGKTIGKGKEGREFHCHCKNGYYTKGSSTLQTLECRYSEFDKKNYFYKGSNRVERFDQCQLFRGDPIFTQCYILIKDIIGYEVDDEGYPHRYSKLAYATLGWANAHMLISVCAWCGLGIYLYRLGVL
ncbi:unnamed protein product [Cyprideis torosa]|uniref:Uncharacterized protein n=1 Tax=Cyprideis torosa TaxID=163714 RepID=A0A7R8ZP69_9CRUS|nr:unnamed protein product [Cyprideis torosa]CAG0899776.1 unnamed protein product [Cyprideis torosa]